MVDLKTAYNIANDFFLENGYVGISETRENDKGWLFSGECEEPTYGTSEVFVPKDGTEPYLFDISHKEELAMWESAKVVLPLN